MKNIKLSSFVILILFFGITACSENPLKPNKEPEEPFLLTYKFKNIGDTTVKRFDIRLAAYYPKQDSSSLVITGLSDAAVGYQLKETMDEKGLPGVEMFMVFGVNKIWPEHWPNQDPRYPTYKWYYIERCIVKYSTQATMSFVWPQDTARANVHVVVRDTLKPTFEFWGPKGTKEAC